MNFDDEQLRDQQDQQQQAQAGEGQEHIHPQPEELQHQQQPDGMQADAGIVQPQEPWPPQQEPGALLAAWRHLEASIRCPSCSRFLREPQIIPSCRHVCCFGCLRSRGPGVPGYHCPVCNSFSEEAFRVGVLDDLLDFLVWRHVAVPVIRNFFEASVAQSLGEASTGPGGSSSRPQTPNNGMGGTSSGLGTGNGNGQSSRNGTQNGNGNGATGYGNGTTEYYISSTPSLVHRATPRLHPAPVPPYPHMHGALPSTGGLSLSYRGRGTEVERSLPPYQPGPTRTAVETVGDPRAAVSSGSAAAGWSGPSRVGGPQPLLQEVSSSSYSSMQQLSAPQPQHLHAYGQAATAAAAGNAPPGGQAGLRMGPPPPPYSATDQATGAEVSAAGEVLQNPESRATLEQQHLLVAASASAAAPAASVATPFLGLGGNTLAAPARAWGGDGVPMATTTFSSVHGDAARPALHVPFPMPMQQQQQQGIGVPGASSSSSSSSSSAAFPTHPYHQRHHPALAALEQQHRQEEERLLASLRQQQHGELETAAAQLPPAPGTFPLPSFPARPPTSTGPSVPEWGGGPGPGTNLPSFPISAAAVPMQQQDPHMTPHGGGAITGPLRAGTRLTGPGGVRLGRSGDERVRLTRDTSAVSRELGPLGANLFVCRLPEWADELDLRRLVTSAGLLEVFQGCSVARHEEGFSKNVGFLSFKTPQAAFRALTLLDGAQLSIEPEDERMAIPQVEKKAGGRLIIVDVKRADLAEMMVLLDSHSRFILQQRVQRSQ